MRLSKSVSKSCARQRLVSLDTQIYSFIILFEKNYIIIL